jgi:hypothetical protein
LAVTLPSFRIFATSSLCTGFVVRLASLQWDYFRCQNHLNSLSILTTTVTTCRRIDCGQASTIPKSHNHQNQTNAFAFIPVRYSHFASMSPRRFQWVVLSFAFVTINKTGCIQMVLNLTYFNRSLTPTCVTLVNPMAVSFGISFNAFHLQMWWVFELFTQLPIVWVMIIVIIITIIIIIIIITIILFINIWCHFSTFFSHGLSN